jgi:uncharacterized protein (TIGR02145 family)
MSGFNILPDPNKFRLEPGELPVTPPVFHPSYGLLYNWYAATDVRNIAASGWHLPSEAEYVTLWQYLDPTAGVFLSFTAGGLMKESGYTYWSSPNTGATNTSGFNGRGSGYRMVAFGIFMSLNTYCYFHISDDNTPHRVIYLRHNEAFVGRAATTGMKQSGVSIRFVKDSTTLAHGQTGTYTGNDGKVYRAICIGTQEWLADNLAETKYRNGDDIPEVTDNATWAALNTGALCAYDNDWNNV